MLYLKAKILLQASDEWSCPQLLPKGSKLDLFITSQCGQLHVSGDITNISVFMLRHYHWAAESNQQGGKPYSSEML